MNEVVNCSSGRMLGNDKIGQVIMTSEGFCCVCRSRSESMWHFSDI